jgi:hypothetical protein
MERSGIAAHIKDPANGRIITQLSELMPVSNRRAGGRSLVPERAK